LKVVLVPAVVLLFPVLPSLSAHRPAKPWWLAALAALLVVAGVAVMELAGARPRLGVGQLWALGQVFGFGTGYICVEHTLSEFPRHALQLSALQVIVIAVLSATWSVTVASAEKGSFALPDTTWVAADGRLVVAILYTGLVTTSLTVWLQTVALARVSSSEVVVILSTEPFFASVMASRLIGEPMRGMAAVGGALIFLACVVNELGGRSEGLEQGDAELTGVVVDESGDNKGRCADGARPACAPGRNRLLPFWWHSPEEMLLSILRGPLVVAVAEFWERLRVATPCS
jgi:drug/metabolite transporter (DMT)-like permease